MTAYLIGNMYNFYWTFKVRNKKGRMSSAKDLWYFQKENSYYNDWEIIFFNGVIVFAVENMLLIYYFFLEILGV